MALTGWEVFHPKPQDTKIPARYRLRPAGVTAAQYLGQDMPEVCRLITCEYEHYDPKVRGEVHIHIPTGFIPVQYGEWVVKAPRKDGSIRTFPMSMRNFLETYELDDEYD